ncbi:hypothetical protein BDY21DRAFT_354307 [Lineolata rhizophorae]|uniref:T6SS Phospholipase effector Tle1-like catalytic domain-containing protein n=1 Tax=Lineolata rhizophorae TaxID=578093 RepID=A0A6A6NRH7_9PEZI|nr:hypothetical protein BDY21DRAFT_354307 [Lineolata rhizophorae]
MSPRVRPRSSSPLLSGAALYWLGGLCRAKLSCFGASTSLARAASHRRLGTRTWDRSRAMSSVAMDPGSGQQGYAVEGLRPVSKNRKRLVVLCDGTWQDSTTEDESTYPSNVTRFARTLSKYAFLKETGEEVEQIVYYQKGIGTGVLDRYLGGAFGLGLSSNVRGCYSFLAHNYDPGDTIHFFGFSRGAYTARAIAGLVNATGLLTKRGMDSFAHLYGLYYDRTLPEAEKQRRQTTLVERLVAAGDLDLDARDAVCIVGVWDTVAFHKPWVARLPGAAFLGLDSGERIEFKNAKLSPRVNYGFHALSLDDGRELYKPTVWEARNTAEGPGEDGAVDVVAGGNVEGGERSTRTKQVVKQVWFSGEHTDVGGGRTDHRLSDITLAWMVSECMKTGELEFDLSYLRARDESSSSSMAPSPGSDARVPSTTGSDYIDTVHSSAFARKVSRSSAAPMNESLAYGPAPWATHLGPTRQEMAWYWHAWYAMRGLFPAAIREPDEGQGVHCSVADRALSKEMLAMESCKDAVVWPCGPLTGLCRKEEDWLEAKGGKRLPLVGASGVELVLKDNVRGVEVGKRQ